MVVPLRRRTTKSPAQRTSEGRVSEEMVAGTLSLQWTCRLPRHHNDAETFPRDLMKDPG